MDIWEMRRNINEAKEVLRNADEIAGLIAAILPGRLRHVPSWILCDMKKELRDFNAHTGNWKEL
jgi:hypothetical protein